ncbi:MAG: helix-turn-helix domain-containing protein [Gammaproteobacteria bacterium]|nr:helix-turn-helix domain-containing protein [Gammaproteobacteria bacterium]
MPATAEVIELAHRLPTQDEIDSAAEAATALARTNRRDGAPVFAGPCGEAIELPPAIAELVIDLLGHIAHGDMVTIVPTGAMLTTKQAADILNVSRPYLSKLLKDGDIPFVPVGSHRRVVHADLMAYKNRRDATRRAALDELARLGQEFDAS